MGIRGAALLGFLLLAPWPFWRLATSTPVRQRRRDQLALLVVLGGYGLAVSLVALRWPALLPVLVGLAVVVVVAQCWRSRPSFRSGPGSPRDGSSYILWRYSRMKATFVG